MQLLVLMPISDRMTAEARLAQGNNTGSGARMGPGFLTMLEWWRDFSNRPFFLTSNPWLLQKEQNTAVRGLVWRWGGKRGPW